MAILRKQHLFLAWMAFFIYAAILSIGTHTPSDSAPSAQNFDKLLHFTAFVGLAFLLVHAVNASREKPVFYGTLYVLPIVAIYGALDELFQILVPGRHADVWDWLADVGGAAAGIAIYGAIFLVVSRFRRRSPAST